MNVCLDVSGCVHHIVCWSSRPNVNASSRMCHQLLTEKAFNPAHHSEVLQVHTRYNMAGAAIYIHDAASSVWKGRHAAALFIFAALCVCF